MAEGRLAGAAAIVTGAAEGIAEATAKALAREGAAVAVVSRNLARCEKVVLEIARAGGNAIALEADVRLRHDVQRMVRHALDRLGRVDILVNGVGGYHQKAPIEDMTEDEWDEVITLNLKTAFLCAQAVVPAMKAQRRGRIVNIGSVAGNGPYSHSDSFLPYGASKAGLVGFTKHLAKQLGPHGITVNIVSPGTTRTERALRNRGPEAIERMKAEAPLRAILDPEDTAEAIVYLTSEAGRYVTGVNLNVNAGSMII